MKSMGQTPDLISTDESPYEVGPEKQGTQPLLEMAELNRVRIQLVLRLTSKVVEL